MKEATVGSFVINASLPEDLRDWNRVWDKKTTAKVLTELARRHPDLYRDVSHKLLQFGYQSAYLTGGQSFSLKDISEASVVKAIREQINRETQAILEKWYKKGIRSDDPRVQKEIVENTMKHHKAMNEGTLKERQKEDSPFYHQAVGTGAQKPGTFNSIIGADLLYVDQEERPIPLPVLHGYSYGLEPAEYFAGSFGARKGSVDLQKATSDAGFMAKQLVQIAHRGVVTADDSPDPYDASTPVGYPVDTDDEDNVGTYLSHPAGGYARNTLLTPAVLADLKKKGIPRILIRSVTVGGPANGGYYSYDAGVREFGQRPSVGEFVGISAVQSISEPITQAAISCLHPGTRVRMADGSIKKLRDIRVGDQVLGSDTEGHTAAATVLNVFDNGIQPVYRTLYRYGDSKKVYITLYATKEHKALLTTRKYSCKDEMFNGIPRILKIGTPCKSVCAVLSSEGIHKDGTHEPFALLMGLLLGNGCYTKALHNNVYISCFDTTQVDELKGYLDSINIRFSFHKGSQCYYRVVAKENPGAGSSSPNPIKQILHKYGTSNKYSYQKSIPKEVDTWSTESVQALLSGLWDTDGSIYTVEGNKHPFTAYGSTSRKRVHKIKDLLEVHAGAHTCCIYQSRSKRKRTLYSIVYAHPSEVQKVLTFLHLHGIKETLRQQALETLTRHIATLSSNRKRFTCKRQSQEFFGLLPTMDIEVDNKDHLFVLANGLIVSNSKHSGGVIGSDANKSISGFAYLNQLIQVPKRFKQGAVHATLDGRITKIEKVPQGGFYVFINGEKHYVGMQQGQDANIIVKPGDTVEAGDALTDGIPNPAMIVKYKGIGEGRRAFVNQFHQALKNSGQSVSRRNLEALGRGLISYVRLTDEVGDYAPDDILPYSMVTAGYTPRKGFVEKPAKELLGYYLEKPVLHYTLGTRIRPSMLKELNDFGIRNVTAHKDPPPFEPEMVRGMEHVCKDPDWGTRLLGGYQKDSILEGARRGASSYTEGTSYVPALAFGGPDFGRRGAIAPPEKRKF